MKRLTFVFVAILTALIFTGCPGVVEEPEPEPETYSVGVTGPAGGLIFYDDTIGYDFDVDGTIQADEKNLMTDKRYLEAALNTWNGGTEDPKAPWGDQGTDITGLDNILNSDKDTLAGTVGNGAENTSVIVAHMEGKSITGTAAQLCAAYTGGAKNDWFLPSAGELDLMYTNLHQQSVGDFICDVYWSSSERHDTAAWRLAFLIPTRLWAFASKGFTPYASVRAVRAF